MSPLYRTQIESGRQVRLIWVPARYAIGDKIKLRGSAREWFVTYQWARQGLTGKGEGGKGK